MKLTSLVNAIVQTAGAATQILNLAIGSGYLSPKGQAALAGAAAFVQGLVALLAHYSNPDGTPAAVAYVAKK